MAKDLKAAALKAVQKKSLNMENVSNKDSEKSKMYKDYFSLEDGKPIAFDSLCKRVKRRLSDIDRASTGAMLDLFFLYQNWNGFYSRTDSFSKYLKDDIQISRTHAYGIINSVELLNQYFIHRGNQEADLGNFMNEITSSIESIGISKLITISAMKDDEQKYGFVDRLLEGENITVEALRQKPEKKENPPKRVTAVSINGDDLKVVDQVVLRFESQNQEIRKSVVKVVEKWYLKSLQPKKGK